eukprot:TRINITY_DN14309_c0_g1_i1.p1 TRINITY_DN14309_c0_g1~~TRINITY_DN14309_c0_g1_i1.p1  ORF type:complete len:1163 (+),score=157.10 TRINITY_DN14309_c0_g1_i1:111-3491(+)
MPPQLELFTNLQQEGSEQAHSEPSPSVDPRPSGSGGALVGEISMRLPPQAQMALPQKRHASQSVETSGAVADRLSFSLASQQCAGGSDSNLKVSGATRPARKFSESRAVDKDPGVSQLGSGLLRVPSQGISEWSADAGSSVAPIQLEDLDPELQRLWFAFSDRGKHIGLDGIGALMHHLGYEVTAEEVVDLAVLLSEDGGTKLDLEGFIALCGGLDDDTEVFNGDSTIQIQIPNLPAAPITARRRKSVRRWAATSEQQSHDRWLHQLRKCRQWLEPLQHLVITAIIAATPLRIAAAEDIPRVEAWCLLCVDAVLLIILLCCARLAKVGDGKGHRRSSAKVPQCILRFPTVVWRICSLLYSLRSLMTPGLALDLVALIPLEVLACCGGWGICTGSTDPLWRLNKLLLTRHISVCLTSGATLIGRLTGLSGKSRIVRTFLMWVCQVHACACGFLVVASIVGDENTQGVTTLPQFSERSLLLRYLQACDWASKTTTGLSRGQPIPPTDLQHAYGLFTMMCGVTVYAIFIAAVSSTLQQPTTYSRFLDKLESVNAVLMYKQLPSQFRDECLNYYRHMYRTTGAFSDEVGVLLHDLPLELARKLNVALGQSMLKKVTMFRDVTEGDFFADLVTKLVQNVVVPGTVICREGEVGADMHFITHGAVDVIVGGKTVATLGSGTAFGEIAVLLDVPRTATVTSNQYTTMLTLHRYDFNEVVTNWPEVQMAIELAAQPAIEAALAQEASEQSMCRSRRGSAMPRPSFVSSVGTDGDTNAGRSVSFLGMDPGAGKGIGYRANSFAPSRRRSSAAPHPIGASFRRGSGMHLGAVTNSQRPSAVSACSGVSASERDLAAIGISRQPSGQSLGKGLRLRDAIRKGLPAAKLKKVATAAVQRQRARSRADGGDPAAESGGPTRLSFASSRSVSTSRSGSTRSSVLSHREASSPGAQQKGWDRLQLATARLRQSGGQLDPGEITVKRAKSVRELLLEMRNKAANQEAPASVPGTKQRFSAAGTVVSTSSIDSGSTSNLTTPALGSRDLPPSKTPPLSRSPPPMCSEPPPLGCPANDLPPLIATPEPENGGALLPPRPCPPQSPGQVARDHTLASPSSAGGMSNPLIAKSPQSNHLAPPGSPC